MKSFLRFSVERRVAQLRNLEMLFVQQLKNRLFSPYGWSGCRSLGKGGPPLYREAVLLEAAVWLAGMCAFDQPVGQESGHGRSQGMPQRGESQQGEQRLGPFRRGAEKDQQSVCESRREIIVP